MLIQDGQVLLIRHTYIEGWSLPGGGLKRGETLEAAARREVREEAGAEMGMVSLIGAYSNFDFWKSDHNVVFLCTDFRVTGRTDFEIAERRLFPLEALPKDTFPGHRLRIEEYRLGEKSPRFGEW
jgi:ADP-ribose pyrophosphatase YjhB (NUDIX family)